MCKKYILLCPSIIWGFEFPLPFREKPISVIFLLCLYSMTTIKFKYWQDQKFWIGYLEEYPDYITQGESFEELKENLTDIFNELLRNR